MSQVYFKKEGLGNYMVMPCENELDENYQSSLFQYHEVPYFLPYEVRQLDGRQYIYYKLKYRTTVKSVLGHLQLTFSRVQNMAASMVGALEMTEEYLLDPEGIIWNSNQIFLEADTGNLQFCYCPVQQRENGSLRDLLTELIQAVDKKEEKSILFILQFYNMVTEPDCSLEKMKSFVGKENRIPGNFMKENANARNERYDFGLEREEFQQNVEKYRHAERVVQTLLIITAVINIILIASLLFDFLTYDYVRYLFISLGALIVLTIVYMYVSKEETPDEMMQAYFENSGKLRAGDGFLSNKRNEEKNNFIVSTAVSGSFVAKEEKAAENRNCRGNDLKEETYGETSVLTGGYQEEENKQDNIAVENYNKYLYLESMEKGKYEPVYMDKQSVVLGTMPDGCNYTLKARGISRMHAKLMKKPDGLYLLDLNSTNGTYLNGEMIESGRDYKLEEGDMVTFALSEFYVASKINV